MLAPLAGNLQGWNEKHILVEARPPESAATGGETVLVVDDEESVRTILSRGLSAHGYATMQATNGREGLEILQCHHIDLILLDLSMP